MSLIDDIRDGATDCGTNFDSTLRRAYILATRLGHEPFLAWVDRELKGYPGDVEVPSYRVIHTSIWYEAAGPGMRRAGTATWDFFSGNTEAFESASKISLRQNVAQLASWIRDSNDAKFMPDSVVRRHLESLMEQNHLGLVSCRQVVSLAAIEGLRSNICTSLLQFVLEIEKRYPEVAEQSIPQTPETERVVGAIYNNIIVHGGNPMFSMASGDNPVAVNVTIEQKLAGASRLMDYLRAEGLEIDDLGEVIEGATVADADQPNSGVGQWIGRLSEAGKLASKTVAVEAVKHVVTQIMNGQIDPAMFPAIFG